MAIRTTLVMGLATIFVVLLVPVISLAQQTQLTIDPQHIDRETRTFTVPVNLANDGHVAGVQINITTDPTGIITPVSGSRAGSRIEYWEYFNTNISPADPNVMLVLGLANMPGGQDTPPLEPGDGLLFNITFKFECGYEINSSIDVAMDNIALSDTTGYVLFDVTTDLSPIMIGEDTALRGDINGDGQVVGADITYLLRYFQGDGDCPVSLRAGDINADGRIINSDLSYLARFIYDDGPPPPPGN